MYGNVESRKAIEGLDKSRRSVGGYAALLLLFFLVAYILPLGERALIVPDETRYAEIPREMISGGDWISPHLDGLRYFEKPVLGYWMHAGSILLFGENNFAVRFPSALAVGLSALLIFGLVSRMYRDADEKNQLTAPLAALIFLSSFEVFGVGNTAVLDNLFSFFLTATIIAFFFASEAPRGSAGEKGFLVLSGIACGLVFLTKGFLAFALPVLALVPYLVWQRRYWDLFRMSWLPLLTALVVALPWGIAIYLKEPDFWHHFFWIEHIHRFMSDNAQHRHSFWLFFMAAPGLILPWTFLVPAAAGGIWKLIVDKGVQNRLIRFSLCWLVLPFLFFSFSKGKLLTYILPCFPPFAVLMALGLTRTLETGKKKAFQWGVISAGIFFSFLLAALIYIQLAGLEGAPLYSRIWQGPLAINGLLFFMILCFSALKGVNASDKILLFGLAPLLMFFAVHFLTPDRVLEKKAPGPLLERHLGDAGKDTLIISDGSMIRSACWYLKRKDVYVLGDAGELEYGLTHPDADGRFLDVASAVRLIKSHPGKAILVARSKKIRKWLDLLPRPVYEDTNGPVGYTLLKY